MWDRLNKRFVTYELCAWYKVVQKYARTLHMPKRHLLHFLLILRVHDPRLLMTNYFLQLFSIKSSCKFTFVIWMQLVNTATPTKGFCIKTWGYRKILHLTKKEVTRISVKPELLHHNFFIGASKQISRFVKQIYSVPTLILLLYCYNHNLNPLRHNLSCPHLLDFNQRTWPL